MVKLWGIAFLGLACWCGAAEPTLKASPSPSPSVEAPVPAVTVWGYEAPAGRVFVWDQGHKWFLTPPGEANVLGGAQPGEAAEAWRAWGWSVVGTQARFWTLEVHLSDKTGAPQVQRRDEATWQSLAERVIQQGDYRAFAYASPHVGERVELYRRQQLITARAWEPGYQLAAVGLSPLGDLAVAGRDDQSLPFLEINGHRIEAPEGWRGRVTAVAWVAAEAESPGHFIACGWGGYGLQSPTALVWDGLQWQTEPPAALEAGIYPQAIAPDGQQGLVVVGWQALAAGTTRPWIHDVTGPHGLEAADWPPSLGPMGEITAFGVSEKGEWSCGLRRSATESWDPPQWFALSASGLIALLPATEADAWTPADQVVALRLTSPSGP